MQQPGYGIDVRGDGPDKTDASAKLYDFIAAETTSRQSKCLRQRTRLAMSSINRTVYFADTLLASLTGDACDANQLWR